MQTGPFSLLVRAEWESGRLDFLGRFPLGMWRSGLHRRGCDGAPGQAPVRVDVDQSGQGARCRVGDDSTQTARDECQREAAEGDAQGDQENHQRLPQIVLNQLEAGLERIDRAEAAVDGEKHRVLREEPEDDATDDEKATDQNPHPHEQRGADIEAETAGAEEGPEADRFTVGDIEVGADEACAHIETYRENYRVEQDHDGDGAA